MSNPVRIVSLEAENFKRLRAVRLNVNDGITVVAGQNAQGKSSVLDSIAAALGGGKFIPDKALRKGAKSGQIVVETDTITVTRRITVKGTSLTVTAKDGTSIKSPQQVLDAMIGDLTFDPFEFTRMKTPDQIAVLKRAAGVDEQYDKLETERKLVEQQRRDAARELSRLRAVVQSMQVMDKGAKAVDTSAVLEQLHAARTKDFQNQKNREGLAKVRSTLKDLIAEANSLEDQLREVRSKIAKGEAWERLNAASIEAEVDPDVAALERTLAEAGQINQRAAQAEQYRQAEAQLEMAEAEWKKLDRRMEDIAEDKEGGEDPRKGADLYR